MLDLLAAVDGDFGVDPDESRRRQWQRVLDGRHGYVSSSADRDFQRTDRKRPLHAVLLSLPGRAGGAVTGFAR
jgi:hypothetical protein